MHDLSLLAITYKNIGETYKALGDFNAALEYLNLSKTLFEEIKLNKDVSKVKNLIDQVKEKMAKEKDDIS